MGQVVIVAEYWYNTNFHSSIAMTPFEVVYGQKPPLHIPYITGTSPNEVVDRTLNERERVIQQVKHSLQKAQVRMANVANKSRTDREYEVGDYVYLKLQPHRQVSIRQGRQHKFSAKYYGPFEIEARIGKVAYKLKLPREAAIHPVFHISQLKTCHGAPVESTPIPNECIPENSNRIPIKILDRQLEKRKGRPMMKVLVQWSDGEEQDATWETYEDLIVQFPDFENV